ncbi:MAG: hypothetical protein ACRCTY_06250 [Candidatus Adiutrix sp.]
MTINSSSAELIVHKNISNTKTAAATDRHLGQLRHEAEVKANNESKTNWEQNTRESTNMEIGRARNIVTVV